MKPFKVTVAGGQLYASPAQSYHDHAEGLANRLVATAHYLRAGRGLSNIMGTTYKTVRIQTCDTK